MSEAFFARDGDRFVPTLWARGPWSPDAQHAGPPSALLARSFEAIGGSAMRVARFTIEILRSIPMKPLRVEARDVRPGKKVRYVEGSLTDEDDEVARASAWLVRTEEGAAPAVGEEPVPHPAPAATPAFPTPELWGGPSYFTAMEWRFASGTFFEPGPAAAWMRMRIDLVDAEPPSQLARVLVAADSGNGISMELDLTSSLFINTELSVHLVRMPAGEWVCLDARTRVDSHGIGLAESVLWDERGRIGSGAQSLFVGARARASNGSRARKA